MYPNIRINKYTKKKKIGIILTLRVGEYPPGTEDQIVKWFKDHPNVIQSPIVNDSILVNGERKQKLLRELSIREMHNEMLLPVDSGGVGCVRDVDGNVLVSDTSLCIIIKRRIPYLKAAT